MASHAAAGRAPYLALARGALDGQAGGVPRLGAAAVSAILWVYVAWAIMLASMPGALP